MVTFRDAVANAARSTLCAVIALNDDGAKLFGRLPGLRSAADYFNFFAPLRSQLCNDPLDDYVPPEPPFTGGQCPIRYRVFRRSWSNGQGIYLPENEISSNVVGPVSLGPNPEISPPPGGCGPGGFFTNVSVFDGTGTLRVGVASGCFTNPVAFIGFRVQPFDAVPDDCGNPDPEVPPPGPVTRPTEITYNTEEGDEVTYEGDFVFSPYFSVGDLDIRVPFTLNLGGLEWSGNLQIAPEFNLTIAPRVNFGGPNSPDDPDLPPSGDPNTPAVPDPDPEESFIIGVVIRSSPISELQSTAIATVGMPTIFAPRIASCSFAIESSFTVAWTPDIDVKNRDCYIACPVPTGAVGVAVSPMPGWEVSWTAVRGRPLT